MRAAAEVEDFPSAINLIVRAQIVVKQRIDFFGKTFEEAAGGREAAARCAAVPVRTRRRSSGGAPEEKKSGQVRDLPRCEMVQGDDNVANGRRLSGGQAAHGQGERPAARQIRRTGPMPASYAVCGWPLTITRSQGVEGLFLKQGFGELVERFPAFRISFLARW